MMLGPIVDAIPQAHGRARLDIENARRLLFRQYPQRHSPAILEQDGALITLKNRLQIDLMAWQCGWAVE